MNTHLLYLVHTQNKPPKKQKFKIIYASASIADAKMKNIGKEERETYSGKTGIELLLHGVSFGPFDII